MVSSVVGCDCAKGPIVSCTNTQPTIVSPSIIGSGSRTQLEPHQSAAQPETTRVQSAFEGLSRHASSC